LREAVVTGDCDFNDVRTTLPVELESCVFTGSIQLDRAHLSSLDLTGSEFTTLSAWYLDCEHDVSLTGVRCAEGLELAHAHIGGRLTLTGSAITNTAGPALYADNARIDGDANARPVGNLVVVVTSQPSRLAGSSDPYFI
jgi:hypothetical protein